MAPIEINPIQGLNRGEHIVDFRPISAEARKKEEEETVYPLGVPESATALPPDPTLPILPRTEAELEEVARMEREQLSQRRASESPASAEKDSTPKPPQPPVKPGS